MSSPKVKASTTNKSKNTKEQEREWPVQLYRFTEGNNKWQKDEQKGVTATIMKAVPRKDCIVIPAIKQKFSVLSGQGKHCVIQRDSCILLVSQKRTRALVLQFKNREDCLAFSDRFLELNQHPTPTDHSEVQGASLPAPQAAPEVEAGLDEQERIVSYIARLLHDKEFLKFTHKLETFLSNAEDGEKILEGLENRDLSLI